MQRGPTYQSIFSSLLLGFLFAQKPCIYSSTRLTKKYESKAETLSSDGILRRIGSNRITEWWGQHTKVVLNGLIDWKRSLCVISWHVQSKKGAKEHVVRNPLENIITKESPRPYKLQANAWRLFTPHENPNAMHTTPHCHSRVPYCRQSLLTLTNAPAPPSELSMSTRTSAWATTFSRAAEDGLPSDTVTN
jgi:hypothetical protein